MLYVDSSNIRLKSPIRSDESELIFRIQAMDITGLIFEKSFTLKVTEPSIRINEFMASNGNTLKDDDGEALIGLSYIMNKPVLLIWMGGFYQMMLTN